jgi:hypothetical protein
MFAADDIRIEGTIWQTLCSQTVSDGMEWWARIRSMNADHSTGNSAYFEWRRCWWWWWWWWHPNIIIRFVFALRRVVKLRASVESLDIVSIFTRSPQADWRRPTCFCGRQYTVNIVNSANDRSVGAMKPDNLGVLSHRPWFWNADIGWQSVIHVSGRPFGDADDCWES